MKNISFKNKLSGYLWHDFIGDKLTRSMLACDCNPSLHSCIVPKKKRNDAAANNIYKATEDINEEAIEVPQPEQRRCVGCHWYSSILSAASSPDTNSSLGQDSDWCRLEYCQLLSWQLGKGGYNIPSEKCKKPFKEWVKPPWLFVEQCIKWW